MGNEPVKKITVTKESSLAKLLREAAARPLLLENNGDVFLLERMAQEGDTLTAEEITRSKDGILQAAGSWKDIDTEGFKAYIKERRQTANRPSVKL